MSRVRVGETSIKEGEYNKNTITDGGTTAEVQYLSEAVLRADRRI